MWSGWNGQLCWIREVVEFDWRVFFVDGSVWIVPSDGGKGANVDVSLRGGWLVSEKAMNGKSKKDREENGEEDQYRCRGVRHDDCLLKS